MPPSTRDEIVKETSLTDGGGLTRRLTELEQCGFIRRYSTINNARQLYQLTDFYTQFYYQFLAGGKTYDDEQWLHLQGTSKHNGWLGLSFERLCFVHMPQIRQALGIAGVATKTFAYQTDGAQVDMVIERADKTVCVCEMKWSALPYAIKKAENGKIVNHSLQSIPQETQQPQHPPIWTVSLQVLTTTTDLAKISDYPSVCKAASISRPLPAVPASWSSAATT